MLSLAQAKQRPGSATACTPWPHNCLLGLVGASTTRRTSASQAAWQRGAARRQTTTLRRDVQLPFHAHFKAMLCCAACACMHTHIHKKAWHSPSKPQAQVLATKACRCLHTHMCVCCPASPQMLNSTHPSSAHTPTNTRPLSLSHARARAHTSPECWRSLKTHRGRVGPTGRYRVAANRRCWRRARHYS
jgi:hypothetical protein